jgi:hypothetical protein
MNDLAAMQVSAARRSNLDLRVAILDVDDMQGRDGSRLARDIARATVRASFRRFFPASAATLVPERTLSAIRNVWGALPQLGRALEHAGERDRDRDSREPDAARSQPVRVDGGHARAARHPVGRANRDVRSRIVRDARRRRVPVPRQLGARRGPVSLLW